MQENMIVKILCIAISLFITLLYVIPVSGIRCWDCRSDVDPGCADPFDNTSLPIVDCRTKSRPHIKDIAPEATMCRKMRQKVDGKWRYIRSCAWLGEPGYNGDERICNYSQGTYNIFVEYCNCKSKDGCNTSSLLQISYFCLALFPFLMLLV